MNAMGGDLLGILSLVKPQGQGNTKPPKEPLAMPCAGPDLVQDYCIHKVLIPMLHGDPPSTEAVVAALWQRVQVGKDPRTSDLFQVKWDHVGHEQGTPYMDIISTKRLRG